MRARLQAGVLLKGLAQAVPIVPPVVAIHGRMPPGLQCRRLRSLRPTDSTTLCQPCNTRLRMRCPRPPSQAVAFAVRNCLSFLPLAVPLTYDLSGSLA